MALANSLATFLEMGALLIIMRRRLSGLEGSRTLKGVLHALLAGGGMALALWGWQRLAGSFALSSVQTAWVTALGGIVVGVLVYGLILMALRTPELRMVFSALKRRFIHKTNA